MTNKVQFRNGRVQFCDGKVAFDPARCCGGSPCQWCVGGNTPNEFKVVIDGMSSRSCNGGNCIDINDTYILQQAAPPNQCNYIYTADETGCDVKQLALFLQFRVILIIATYATGGLDELFWRKSFGSDIPCTTFSDYDVPLWIVNPGLCKLATSPPNPTCLITSL